jgi:hypothetical protein
MDDHTCNFIAFLCSLVFGLQILDGATSWDGSQRRLMQIGPFGALFRYNNTTKFATLTRISSTLANCISVTSNQHQKALALLPLLCSQSSQTQLRSSHHYHYNNSGSGCVATSSKHLLAATLPSLPYSLAPFRQQLRLLSVKSRSQRRQRMASMATSSSSSSSSSSNYGKAGKERKSKGARTDAVAGKKKVADANDAANRARAGQGFVFSMYCLTHSFTLTISLSIMTHMPFMCNVM